MLDDSDEESRDLRLVASLLRDREVASSSSSHSPFGIYLRSRIVSARLD